MNKFSLKMKFLKLIKYPLCKILYKTYGFKSIIYKPIMINGKKYIEIGKSVRFFTGARIEAIDTWGDKKYLPSIKIGNQTSFEQNVHITSAGKLEIGSNCVILPNVLITNINHNYDLPGVNVLKQSISVKEVTIGNNCFIGMGAKIFPGVHIGDNVIIGANSIVMTDIPSFSVVVGTPAKIVKKFNQKTNEWVKIGE